uniref:Calcium binding and coiled-coil domain 1b n=1 Tax=Scleropages formosus TaxID=113540 RepID=A0A8C9S5I2_SCLFO
METWKVAFQNVGQNYFPQSRVECHYSLNEQHSWASNDWIGLFEVGWCSVRDYHTFVWARAPEGYTEGTSVNCCVHFQASYLPSPSAKEYQFVYVDGKGEVCARSLPFTFSLPEPLEDVVTLEEGCDGEGEEEEILLVVPRAQLLQTRLEECLQERSELLQAKEVAERGRRQEREQREKAQKEWGRVREELEGDVHELKGKLRQSREDMAKTEEKLKEFQSVHEALLAERGSLLAEKAEREQQIKDLDADVSTLTKQGLEREMELDRMKEKIKKMSAQRREEEVERKRLQVELEASLREVNHLQERLFASERVAEGLRTQLAEQSAHQDCSQTELHQARLQAAQLTLQLSDTSLALKERRAAWAQEREELRCSLEEAKGRVWKLSAELQQKEEQLQEERMEREKLEVELGKEKDCHRVSALTQIAKHRFSARARSRF